MPVPWGSDFAATTPPPAPLPQGEGGNLVDAPRLAGGAEQAKVPPTKQVEFAREGGGRALDRGENRLRRLAWPGLATVAMLAILLALGTWQVRRLAWKEALLDRIAQAESAPAVDLPANPSTFQKVRIRGRLRTDLSAWYGAEVRETATGPQLGAQLIQPLAREGAPAVLVDRGWAPSSYSPPANSRGGEVTIEGYVRPAARPAWFTPTPDAAARHFFALDPPAIGVALGLRDVAPFVLVALGPADTTAVPIPAAHLPRPPNNHLGYAITWYGLALALLLVFGSWARTAFRGERSSR